MADGILGWHFFDVEGGSLPEGCGPSGLPGRGKGRIVALAATPFACRNDWAGQAAVSLAKAWAAEGLRIFLMDLALDSPTLHRIVGLPNEEGVSDAFLFGASVQRIARPALDGSIFFASAGTGTGDPEEVLENPRWNDLAGGFSEADATLLLFLPTQVSGARKILSRASDIVFLAGQGESAEQFLGLASVKVVATLGPVGSLPEALPSSLSRPEPWAPAEADVLGIDLDLAAGFGDQKVEDDAFVSMEEGQGLKLAEGFLSGLEEEEGRSQPGVVRDTDAASESPKGEGGDTAEEDLPSRPPDFGAEFVDLPPLEDEGGFEGLLVQGPDFGSPAAESPSGAPSLSGPPAPTPEEDDARAAASQTRVQAPDRPAPKRRTPPKRKLPLFRIVSLPVLLGLAGGVVATALGLIDIPGLTDLREYFGDLPDPALERVGPVPVEEILRYSLVLRSYRGEQRDLAEEMVAALRERFPDLLFVLVPEAARGGLGYVILAGPALSLEEGEALRTPLGAAFPREDPNAWVVRETPRAFLLTSTAEWEDAGEIAASAAARGVPAYVLGVTYRAGEEGFEVLAGAYEGVEDARPLQRLLRGAGFGDVPLVERRGRLPE